MKCLNCHAYNADALASGRNEGLCVGCQGEPIYRKADGLWECADCGAVHSSVEYARECRMADLELRVLGPARMAHERTFGN